MNLTYNDVSIGLSVVTNVALGGGGGQLIVGEVVHGEEGDLWEISICSSHFCCEPKTALKTVF